jgi:O-antigen/teichoic acid export membrane protein
MLRNKIVKYIFSRYAIYVLQLANTLVLAEKLSSYYFGIWAFIQMILLYFAHFDLGIPSSFNAVAAIYQRKKRYVAIHFYSALTLICILSLIVLFLTTFFDYDIGSKFKFNKYLFYVIPIIVLTYFNKLLMNLYRVYNKLNQIAFYQASTPIAICLSYILFKHDLIEHILLGIILANVLSLLFFIFYLPVKNKVNLSLRAMKSIQKSGIYYFFYNTSFYFVLLSTRSIIGFYYTVEEFGFFNFALSISSIIELSINSILFLIFPKLINKLSLADNQNSGFIIKTMQKNYVAMVSVLSYLFISFYPILISYFPEYKSSVMAFNLVVLTNLIYSNCYSYPILLMSRKRERILAGLAFFLLIINLLFTSTLVFVFKVGFSYAILGSAVAYIIYTILVTRFALKEINEYQNSFQLIRKIFPTVQVIPIIFTGVLILFSAPAMLYITILFLYLTLNFRTCIELLSTIRYIVFKPNTLDI